MIIGLPLGHKVDLSLDMTFTSPLDLDPGASLDLRKLDQPSLTFAELHLTFSELSTLCDLLWPSWPWVTCKTSQPDLRNFLDPSRTWPDLMFWTFLTLTDLSEFFVTWHDLGLTLLTLMKHCRTFLILLKSDMMMYWTFLTLINPFWIYMHMTWPFATMLNFLNLS